MLSERLKTISELVPTGSSVADVGTDHAYLPIFLIQNGISNSVIATDIKEGPLSTAQKNIEESRVKGISLRLCDGLAAVEKGEVDTVVIAGMGGDNIIHIIEEAEWLKAAGKTLVLQPMSSVDDLRRYLAKTGFFIETEIPVIDAGKVYSVMKVKYAEKIREIDLFEAVVGKIVEQRNSAAEKYLKNILSSLTKKANGIKNSRDRQSERQEILFAIEKITKILGEEYGV